MTTAISHSKSSQDIYFPLNGVMRHFRKPDYQFGSLIQSLSIRIACHHVPSRVSKRPRCLIFVRTTQGTEYMKHVGVRNPRLRERDLFLTDQHQALVISRVTMTPRLSLQLRVTFQKLISHSPRKRGGTEVISIISIWTGVRPQGEIHLTGFRPPEKVSKIRAVGDP